MMNGWRLTFKYRDGANRVDLELIGNDAAIRTGLALVAQTVGAKIMGRLSQGNIPEGLQQDAGRLYTIQTGSPVSAYRGPYLRIVPVTEVSGLVTSMTVEWGD